MDMFSSLILLLHHLATSQTLNPQINGLMYCKEVAHIFNLISFINYFNKSTSMYIA